MIRHYNIFGNTLDDIELDWLEISDYMDEDCTLDIREDGSTHFLFLSKQEREHFEHLCQQFKKKHTSQELISRMYEWIANHE